MPKLRDLMQKEKLSLLQRENASLGIDRSLWQYWIHMNCAFIYELIRFRWVWWINWLSSCVVVTHTFQLKAKLSAANDKSFHKEVQTKNLEVWQRPQLSIIWALKPFLQNVNLLSFAGVFLKFNSLSWVSWVHHYFDWLYLSCLAFWPNSFHWSTVVKHEWKWMEEERSRNGLFQWIERWIMRQNLVQMAQLCSCG